MTRAAGAIASISHIFHSRFARGVLVVMSGTVLAQALTVLAAPILTRLYDPAAFGILGVFMALAGIVTPIAGWSYEVAIVLPKKDGDAANVLALNSAIVVLMSLFVLGFVAFAGGWVTRLLDIPGLQPWLWLMPVFILFLGLYGALTYWAIRRKQFGRLTVSRVSQSVGSVGTQLLTGFAGLTPFGLIFGVVAGPALAAANLLTRFWREEAAVVCRSINFERMRYVAAHYGDFPRYKVPQRLLYTLADNSATFLLALLFTPVVAGLYLLTRKVLSLPLELVGESVKKVFYPRANEAYLRGQGELYELLVKSTVILTAVSIIPAGLVMILGQDVFAMVFGEDWREAGLYAQILVAYSAIQMITTPSVASVAVLGLQRMQLFIEIPRLVFTFAALMIGSSVGSPVIGIGGYVLINIAATVALTAYVFYRAWGTTHEAML
jgi:lipopolysaccharide exporter